MRAGLSDPQDAGRRPKLEFRADSQGPHGWLNDGSANLETASEREPMGQDAGGERKNPMLF